MCTNFLGSASSGLPSYQIAWVSESHLAAVPKASSLESEKTELAFLTGLAHLRDAIRRQEAEEKKLIEEIEERHSCIKVFMKDKSSSCI
ncbi:hypothetical protein AHF37_07574 [Paragonimus kellicotti]|nr:hypothetical protein AHF37_07574 [Paragonimus kellicotti]